jgi:hypothetical protein
VGLTYVSFIFNLIVDNVVMMWQLEIVSGSHLYKFYRFPFLLKKCAKRA